MTRHLDPDERRQKHVAELDLLIERQIRAANDPDQGSPNYEVQPDWPVVAGEVPPELDPSCRMCDGEGSDPEDGSTCPVCGGSGVERSR